MSQVWRGAGRSTRRRTSDAGERQTILVAASDDILQMVNGSPLGRIEYSLAKASNPADLPSVSASLQPRLVLLDAALGAEFGPGGAVGCCRALKRSGEGAAPLVVVGSPCAPPAEADGCYAAGCEAYLPRPVTRRDLIARLQELLGVPTRAHFRVPVEASIALEVDSRPVTGTVRDLSEGGFFVELNIPPVPGRNVRFRFVLPGGGPEVAGWARVVRVQPGQGLGARFLSVPATHREAIGAHVRRVIAERDLLGGVLRHPAPHGDGPTPALARFTAGERHLGFYEAVARRRLGGPDALVQADALRAMLYEISAAMYDCATCEGPWVAGLLDLCDALLEEAARVLAAVTAMAQAGDEGAARLAARLERGAQEVRALVAAWRSGGGERPVPDVAADPLVQETEARIAGWLRARETMDDEAARLCRGLFPWEEDLLARPREHAARGEAEREVVGALRALAAFRLLLEERLQAMTQRVIGDDGDAGTTRDPDVRSFAYRYLGLTEATLRHVTKLVAQGGGARAVPRGQELVTTRLATLHAVFRLREVYDKNREYGDREFFSSFEDAESLALALKAVEEVAPDTATRPTGSAGTPPSPASPRARSAVLRWLAQLWAG